MGAADYSSSSSFGKWTVQSSSRKEMGRPSSIDIDLSAVSKKSPVSVRRRFSVGFERWGLTIEKQPEGSPPDLAFNRVQTLVCRFFVHAESDRDVRRFTECGVLGGIVTLAEVVDTVAADGKRW